MTNVNVSKRTSISHWLSSGRRESEAEHHPNTGRIAGQVAIDHAGVAEIKEGTISGWIAPESSDREVRISINGLDIATTGAGRSILLNGERAQTGFMFNVKSLWSYLGEGDWLEVRNGSVRLPISTEGMRFQKFGPHASQFEQLRKLIEAGHVFDKFGRLRASISGNVEWQLQVQQLYDAINDVLEKQFHRSAFIVYGTLLGAIREKGFIKNDDDMDVAFLSRYSQPAQVRGEVCDIAQGFLAAGFSVRCPSRRCLKLSRPGTRAHIDLYYTWINQDGSFDISVGYHGKPLISDPDSFSLVRCNVEHLTVLAPRQAEPLLEQLYGPSWRVPDQGFSHTAKTRQLHRQFALTLEQGQRIYWDNYYRDRRCPPASSFAEYVLPRLDPASTIVELGCGNGRDSVFFASAGHTVFGCDMSHGGIAAAQKGATELGVTDCKFFALDISQPDEIDAFFARPELATAIRAPRQLVIYMRFFLHAITEESERTLFSALRRNIPRAYCIVAEFRTDQDSNTVKVHTAEHFRRYIRPADEIARMTREYGLTLESAESGYGFSVYKTEDPHLCRILASAPSRN